MNQKVYLAIFITAALIFVIFINFTQIDNLKSEYNFWKITAAEESGETDKLVSSKNTSKGNNHNKLKDNSKIELETTCSKEASLLGSQQKIISYSLYGNNTLYWNGLPHILKQAETFYPDWNVRIYTDNPKHEFLKPLLKNFKKLYICDVDNLPTTKKSIRDYFPMMWRFYSLGDPQVDIAIFRDSDSELLVREYAAVQEWLVGTNKSLHVMRDYPSHGAPILGGMGGARINPANREKWKILRDLMFTVAYTTKKGYELDMDMLKKFVWPAFVGDLIGHDSYSCKDFTGSVPFPTQRNEAKFIGAAKYRGFQTTVSKMCPIKCRPILHKDWLYC